MRLHSGEPRAFPDFFALNDASFFDLLSLAEMQRLLDRFLGQRHIDPRRNESRRSVARVVLDSYMNTADTDLNELEQEAIATEAVLAFLEADSDVLTPAQAESPSGCRIYRFTARIS